ncbi:SAM-dependent methyltransferase [Saccharopolyspora cebuensis]|uniref:SAM-dependent methyltransferase n=1 Tax=Saccharopolyspora cebuensis TaxID=418759 RepID=A0ABV4CHM8_9PSEU
MTEVQSTPITAPDGAAVRINAAAVLEPDHWNFSVDYALFPSVGEYPVYDDPMYDAMAADEVRNTAYAGAIDRLAPGRTAVEIGTGKHALWSIAAVRAGAEHVYAIEALPAYAELARETIAQAGLSDRITVLDGLSTEVELPERVDLCISEIIGCIGGSEGTEAVLADARDRFLKSDGRSIPHRCVTTVAAVDVRGRFLDDTPAVVDVTVPYVEQIFRAYGRPFDLRMCLHGDVGKVALTDEDEVEALEFNGEPGTGEPDRGTLRVTRAGTLTGLALGVRLWTAPEVAPIDTVRQETSWLPIYAPLSPDGIEVVPGDRIDYEFTRSLSDDEVHPDYAFTGTLHRAAGGDPVELAWDSPHHPEVFRGTTFYRDLFPAG